MARKPKSTNGVGHDQLLAFVERIERLNAEKKTISEDISEVYSEAGSSGFDVKALRAVIRLRAQDAQQRQEFEMILDTYKSALGMIADLPLGQAAIERAGLKRPEQTALSAG